MIIRVSNMRAVSKSSFGRAVKYLTDDQGKAQRVGHTLTLNCRTQDLDQSLLEIESLQTRKQNVRGDKTLKRLFNPWAMRIISASWWSIGIRIIPTFTS